jgi:hypothetical protein
VYVYLCLTADGFETDISENYRVSHLNIEDKPRKKSSWRRQQAGFRPEYENDMFLKNFGSLSTDYMGFCFGNLKFYLNLNFTIVGKTSLFWKPTDSPHSLNFNPINSGLHERETSLVLTVSCKLISSMPLLCKCKNILMYDFCSQSTVPSKFWTVYRFNFQSDSEISFLQSKHLLTKKRH